MQNTQMWLRLVSVSVLGSDGRKVCGTLLGKCDDRTLGATPPNIMRKK